MSDVCAAPRYLAAALLLLVACSDDPAAPTVGDTIEISFTNLPPLDPAREGRWEVWAIDARAQPHSVGRLPAVLNGPYQATLPVTPHSIRVTLEPPRDSDPLPSIYSLLEGEMMGRAARLQVEYALTAGPPLESEPGAHSLFTSSNNAAAGYPSLENAGLWLFNVFPDRNRHRSREVKLTVLQPGWVYEGWIVHRFGTPAEAWLSYGKFRPDQRQLLSSRDDTGSGPFSGDIDYRNGGIEDVPGDEWTTNLFGFQLPPGLTLPFELDAVDANGQAVWTHAITIEPAFDEGEPVGSEQPFGLRLYRNPIGAGGPAMPRTIVFVDGVPSARVVAR